MFPCIHPFIAFIHLLLLLQFPSRCLFLCFVHAYTCLVDVSSFSSGLSATKCFFFDAISFVTFECYGIAMTLALEQYPQ